MKQRLTWKPKNPSQCTKSSVTYDYLYKNWPSLTPHPPKFSIKLNFERYFKFILYIVEKVLCNTDMIHLQDQSPEKRKLRNAFDQIGQIRHLSCVIKSAFFSNRAEDAHCPRDLFYQSYVCPFIPEENNQDISTRPIDCLNNGFLLTWSSQHEGGQWIVKHQTLQVGCHFKEKKMSSGVFEYHWSLPSLWLCEKVAEWKRWLRWLRVENTIQLSKCHKADDRRINLWFLFKSDEMFAGG